MDLVSNDSIHRAATPARARATERAGAAVLARSVGADAWQPDDGVVRRLLERACGLALLSIVKVGFLGAFAGGGGLVLGNPGHGHQPAPARGKYTQNLSGREQLVSRWW